MRFKQDYFFTNNLKTLLLSQDYCYFLKVNFDTNRSINDFIWNFKFVN